MTYAIEQRMRLIDFLLANYASVGPRHLIDYFGISLPQATRDFALYNELHPSNMVYGSSEKSWLATADFKRVYP
jgi:predicted DNA-binding transcriptional regulator YafY